MDKPKLIKDLGIYLPQPTSKQKKHFGLYLCECGKEFVCQTIQITNGHTLSCGCLQRRRAKEANTRHGLVDTPIYKVWKSIKDRCYREKNKDYKYYGAAGIKMCDEWLHDPKAFIDWSIANGYSPELQIDRINSSGNYEPSNCKYSSRVEQMQNTRRLMCTNKSGYRGVYKNGKKWRSFIRHNGRRVYLGDYTDIKYAALAYNDFVITNKTAHPLNPVD